MLQRGIMDIEAVRLNSHAFLHTLSSIYLFVDFWIAAILTGVNGTKTET